MVPYNGAQPPSFEAQAIPGGWCNGEGSTFCTQRFPSKQGFMYHSLKVPMPKWSHVVMPQRKSEIIMDNLNLGFS